MPSIGELFIELGVVGDVKPFEKAIGTMKEAVKQIDNEIKANQRLLKYLQDIKNARNASEKALIKENFANEIKKQKMLDEIDANEKAIDGKKALAANIAGVVKGVGLFVGALTGAAVALNNLTNSLVESNQAMLDLTRTTDIAQSTFQKWGGIGKMLGVENADQQLASLNDRLFDLMLTGEGARGFQLAGINPIGQDANGVMEQLRARVSGMDDTTASYLLRQMGIDPKMLHLLRMSRQEFEELGATIRKYQLNEKQRRDIQDMNIQIQIAAQKLQYLKDKAVLALMPAWTKFMQSLARVVEGLENAVKWVSDFISKSPELQIALKGIAVVLGAILTITHPLWASLVALYLIVDDIMAYFNGGRSGIGYLLLFFDEINEKLNSGKTPEWVRDLLALISNADKLHKLSDTMGKIKNGESVDVSSFDALKNFLSGSFSLLMPHLSPLSLGQPYRWAESVRQNLVTPQMQQNIQNNGGNTTNNTDNKLTMNNYIQTTQPVADIQQQLNYARFAMVQA